jgi:hypothetical protein
VLNAGGGYLYAALDIDSATAERLLRLHTLWIMILTSFLFKYKTFGCDKKENGTRRTGTIAKRR